MVQPAKSWVPEAAGGLADGEDFGVGGGVGDGGDLIGTLRDDGPILNDDGAKRAAAPLPDVFDGEPDGAAEVLLMHGG